MAERGRRRARGPGLILAAAGAAAGVAVLLGCPAGEGSSRPGAEMPTAVDGSLRSALMEIDPDFGDSDEVEFVHLHSVPGDRRVFVEIRVGSVVRTALYEVRLDSGTMRRLAPDPEVFPLVGAGDWRRWPAPAVVRADGRIVLFEDDGIRVVPDPDALVRPGVPQRLPNEAVRAVHGEIDVLGNHLGNVAARDRRSPDGRRILAALTKDRFAPLVPLGVLDLETGEYLSTEVLLDMVDGARVDACVWRDPRTFVLCLWRADLGRRTWHVCTVREDRIDIDAMEPPPGECERELSGMVGDRPVFNHKGPRAEDTDPVVTIGTWGLQDEHGRVSSPVFMGAAGDRALFQGQVNLDVGDEFDPSRLHDSRLIVVEEASDGVGFTADWLDPATIEGGELVGPSRYVSVQDAVPDPSNGASGSAWLLLDERHGLLRLARTDAGSWRVTVVPVRLETSRPQPEQDPRPSGASGGEGAAGQ